MTPRLRADGSDYGSPPSYFNYNAMKTCEFVTPKHPDKLCDYSAYAIGRKEPVMAHALVDGAEMPVYGL